MVDLKNQYKKIKDKVDNSILDVISSTKFINGPPVKEFSKILKII